VNRPPSSHRAGSAVWILTVGALLTLAASPAAAETASAPAVAAGSLWDDARLLGRHERAAVERALRAAAAKSGAPVSIVLVPHLAAHETIEDLARRAFGERGLDAPGPPQVLLAVAKRERRAAVETGQGPAGIVPEIDARQITRHLAASLRTGDLAPLLDDAITRIVVSARATADRRRPSPPDPLDAIPVADSPPSVDAVENGPPPAPAAAPKADPTAPPAAAPSHGLSLYQTAGMLSALVVLGLALRRRRKLASEQAEKPQPPRPRPERKT
jgi:uncharacterized membrane protein YgcG